MKFISVLLTQEDGTTLNVIKKGAIDFIGLPKPNRKTLQSPQMNVVQAHQVHILIEKKS